MPTVRPDDVDVNSFVTRQTKGSQFSHYGGHLEELASWCSMAMTLKSSIKDGPRDGVMIVQFNPAVLISSSFWSPVVDLRSRRWRPEELHAEFAQRPGGEPDEAPFLQITVDHPKIETGFADVVLYRHDLASSVQPDVNDSVAYWQMISINAKPDIRPEPMHPYTMARNQLAMVGGTKAHYTPEEWASSVYFWNNHALVRPR